ncbi:transposase [Streptomyces sp. NPDC001797]|uniref:transposase n=1 Tax=Streptomyces sp. NPDC001797 TaxID=3364610 RepID=UPI00368903CA
MVDTLILDLLDPEKARPPPTAMKDYSDEFKADAVALYESTPGATYKSIAADLGINRATLREWVLRDRERRGVAAAPTTAGRPRSESKPLRIHPVIGGIPDVIPESSEPEKPRVFGWGFLKQARHAFPYCCRFCLTAEQSGPVPARSALDRAVAPA